VWTVTRKEFKTGPTAARRGPWHSGNSFRLDGRRSSGSSRAVCARAARGRRPLQTRAQRYVLLGGDQPGVPDPADRRIRLRPPVEELRRELVVRDPGKGREHRSVTFRPSFHPPANTAARINRADGAPAHAGARRAPEIASRRGARADFGSPPPAAAGLRNEWRVLRKNDGKPEWLAVGLDLDIQCRQGMTGGSDAHNARQKSRRPADVRGGDEILRRLFRVSGSGR
jgi:hypothetical protein